MTFVDISAQLQDDPDDPWMDMLFDVSDVHRQGTRVTLACRCETEFGTAGFNLSMTTQAPAGLIFVENDEDEDVILNEDAVFRDGVQIERSGPESDILVQWLSSWQQMAGVSGMFSRLFGQSEPKRRGTVALTAIHLGEEPWDFENGLGTFKLFHEPGPYGEAFLNINGPELSIALNEKDPDYRQAMISILTSALRAPK